MNGQSRVEIKDNFDLDSTRSNIGENLKAAQSELEDNNIESVREICDYVIQKVIENKEKLSDSEYEKFHSQVALLRLKANQSPFSRNTYIETELFPLVWNSRVEKWIDYYTTRGAKNFNKWIGRSKKYINDVKKILSEHELPEDLAYVPIIESGYSPFAKSHAGAVGMWQFIESTAKKQGLKINYWIDERRDPYKATKAAAKYLKALYEQLGSWEMALAGYNYGASGVRRRIKRWGTDDYWELFLPRETENFVPKIMSAMFIIKEPELFGMESFYEKGYNWKEYTVEDSIDLRNVADLCGGDIQEIQLLNAELKQMCTPPGKEYKIKIPAENYEQFIANFSEENYLTAQQISRRKRRVVYYKVRRGDSLWTISRKFNVSMNAIKKWNNLASTKIYPRDTLKIHRHGL
ncbi:MAG: transglycosylase SLT domain-containing protein [Elusimicrobiota bacterium]